MRAGVLGIALILAAPAAVAAELNSKCAGCHSVASDSPPSLVRQAILNAAGATNIITQAISTTSAIELMKCKSPPEPPSSCITLDASELNALSSLLTSNVATIDGGSTKPNVEKSGIALGIESVVFMNQPVSAFTTIKAVTEQTQYGSVKIIENPTGTWTATYKPKANVAAVSDSFRYIAEGTTYASSVRVVNISIDAPNKPEVVVGDLKVRFNAESFEFDVEIKNGLANKITGIGPSSGMVWSQDGKNRGSGSLTLVSPALNTTLASPSATAKFRYSPPQGGFGDESFTLTVVPAGVEAAKTEFMLTFRVEPEPATVNAATLMVNLNTPTPLDLKPFIGGSGISGVRIASAPAHGQAAINGTVLTYTPRHNYFGPDQLTWSAFGVLGESMMTSTVSVQVVGRPDPSQDPDVRGLVAAQTGAAQRLAWSQIDNVQRRLERLHKPRADTVRAGALAADVPEVQAATAARPGALSNSSREGAFVAATRDGALAASARDSSAFAATARDSSAIAATARDSSAIAATARDSSAIAATARDSSAFTATARDGSFAAAARAARAAAPPMPPRDAAAALMALLAARPAEARDRGGALPSALIGELAQLAKSRALDLGGVAHLGLLPGVGGAADADSGLWLAGRVTLGRRAEEAGQSALRTDTDSATLGFDRRLGPGLSLGLALGGTRERSTIGSLGSVNRASGESLALYGSYQPADRFFIDAMLGHGRLRMNAERVVEPIDDIARQSRRASVSFGALAFGLEHELAPFVLSPYARFDVARHRLGEAVESGAGAYALRYLPQRGQQQRLALGLRIEAPHETDFGAATPWLRLEYSHELKGQASAQVAYADLPSGLYTLLPITSDRNRLALGAGVELFTAKGATLALEYQLEAAAGHLRAQGLHLQWSQRWGSGLLPALPALTAAPLDLQFDAGLTWDDNITRGKDRNDRLTDIVQRAGVSHDKVFALGRTTQAVLRFSLAAEALRRYSALSRAMAEAQAEWRYRGSAAFGAPTTIAFASAAYDDWRSPLRDGPRYGLGVALRVPLTDRLAAAGTLAHNIRRARSAVFDLDDSSLRLNLDYRAGERALYYGAAELRSGDIVSSGRPSLENLGLAERFVEDAAFGDRGFLDYRFKARVGVLRLGVNWRLGSESSLDLSWSRSVAQPRDELPLLDTPSYFANQMRMVYLVRY